MASCRTKFEGEKLYHSRVIVLNGQFFLDCRAQRAPWCPSLSLAFRMLLLIRVSGAMYSNITDCDEGAHRFASWLVYKQAVSCWLTRPFNFYTPVYNFWEPLHYLDRGYGFQTWEVSPAYAIRSWAYILLHLFPASGPVKLLRLDKVSETSHPAALYRS